MGRLAVCGDGVVGVSKYRGDGDVGVYAHLGVVGVRLCMCLCMHVCMCAYVTVERKSCSQSYPLKIQI